MPSGEPTNEEWRLMLRRIRRGRCVPFLGAGASLGFSDGVGLPTASQLACELAKRCDYPGADPFDFFRVTQYFRMVYDPHELRSVVAELLRVPGVRPSIVHRTLAELPFEYVLTTNFDKLMERAFEDVGKAPAPFSYERRGDKQELPNATAQQPVVYKLHGTLDETSAMVLTEDDVVDFLACMIARDPPLPAPVTMLFKEYSILFIGYGLKDLNVRVMLRVLRGRREVAPDIKSFAIQHGRPTDEALAREWDNTVMFFRQAEGLECFDMDAEKFVRELKRRFDAGEGQP
jgi:hypothetical protein